jgi:truncated hemoglobin YjbI
MTITLELEPEVEITAAEQAAEEGLPLTEYVEEVVKQAVLHRKKVKKISEKPFDEILKPFRDEVETSGLNDDELESLFRQARREASQARRNR